MRRARVYRFLKGLRFRASRLMEIVHAVLPGPQLLKSRKQVRFLSISWLMLLAVQESWPCITSRVGTIIVLSKMWRYGAIGQVRSNSQMLLKGPLLLALCRMDGSGGFRCTTVP